ncbi:hypothetical protein BCF11_2519 [Collimonas sp. PA-H2]|nr:hypothetical protein BCF11_2519 [Collimonas sp. PA-H2]
MSFNECLFKQAYIKYAQYGQRYVFALLLGWPKLPEIVAPPACCENNDPMRDCRGSIWVS